MAARGSSRCSSTRSRSCSPSCRAACAAAGSDSRRQALAALRAISDELNLVPRDELDELELRVAQLEHRLTLLEGSHDLAAARRRR